MCEFSSRGRRKSNTSEKVAVYVHNVCILGKPILWASGSRRLTSQGVGFRPQLCLPERPRVCFLMRVVGWGVDGCVDAQVAFESELMRLAVSAWFAWPACTLSVTSK